jgi:hypothetical protein
MKQLASEVLPGSTYTPVMSSRYVLTWNAPTGDG